MTLNAESRLNVMFLLNHPDTILNLLFTLFYCRNKETRIILNLRLCFNLDHKYNSSLLSRDKIFLVLFNIMKLTVNVKVKL